MVIEYKKPDAETRRAYMTNKLSEGGINVNDEDVKNDIERLVGRSDGYTFDFVKELIQCIYIDGIDEDKVFERLNGLIDQNGNIKVTDCDKGKPIGFDGDYDDLSNCSKECADGPKILRNVEAGTCCGC